MAANMITPASHTYKASLYKENVVCFSELTFTSGSLVFVTILEFDSNSTFRSLSMFTIFSVAGIFFGITSDTLEL